VSTDTRPIAGSSKDGPWSDKYADADPIAAAGAAGPLLDMGTTNARTGRPTHDLRDTHAHLGGAQLSNAEVQLRDSDNVNRRARPLATPGRCMDGTIKVNEDVRATAIQVEPVAPGLTGRPKGAQNDLENGTWLEDTVGDAPHVKRLVPLYHCYATAIGANASADHPREPKRYTLYQLLGHLCQKLPMQDGFSPLADGDDAPTPKARSSEASPYPQTPSGRTNVSSDWAVNLKVAPRTVMLSLAPSCEGSTH